MERANVRARFGAHLTEERQMPRRQTSLTGKTILARNSMCGSISHLSIEHLYVYVNLVLPETAI